MPIHVLTASETATIANYGADTYANIHNAGAGVYLSVNGTTLIVGQKSYSGGRFGVYRGVLRFSLGNVPGTMTISGATLDLYGSADYSTTDFNVAIVKTYPVGVPIYDDFDRFEGTDFGNLGSGSCSTGAWNTITFNADGLAYLNSKLGTSEILLGIRSSRDIASTTPTGDEYFNFTGFNSAYVPYLTLTYSEVSVETGYPNVPSFPSLGVINLDTYSIISDCLTGIDADLEETADGDGNIMLGEGNPVGDNEIVWALTSEKISFDAANTRVEVTSLASSSGITLSGDLEMDDLTINTAISAANCEVGGNAAISDAAYASIKSTVTDNDLWWSETSGGNAEINHGEIYMENASGDLNIIIRQDTYTQKVGCLADFSAM